MTDWKADFDALVQETMTYVKSNRVEPPAPHAVITPPLPRTFTEPSRIPTVSRAIHRNDAQVFNSDRKETHWGKRKLKRDE